MHKFDYHNLHPPPDTPSGGLIYEFIIISNSMLKNCYIGLAKVFAF